MMTTLALRAFRDCRRPLALSVAAAALLLTGAAGCDNSSSSTPNAPTAPAGTTTPPAAPTTPAPGGGEMTTPPAAPTTPTAAGSTAAKPKVLAFVVNNASDFWNIAKAGTKKASDEMPGVEVLFRIPKDGTAATQKQEVDALLNRGDVKGIAISPVDPANQTDMLNAAADQTLLITHDSDAPQSKRKFYIGTDNVAAGRQAGEQLKKALPEGGKIVLFVGNLDAQNAKERKQGIEEVLAGSNVTVADTRTDNADRAKAKSNAADILTSMSDVKAMCGLWSYNTPSILSAVEEAGMVGKVKIVGFDEEDATLAGVADGKIECTIVQQPYEFGYQAIVAMSKYADGDASVMPANAQQIVPTLVIDKAKVAEFKADLDKKRAG